MPTSRVIAALALALSANASVAELIQLDLHGEVIPSAGTRWHNPGPLPHSFHGAIVIDSMVFSSRDLDFKEHDATVGARLDNYRFADVAVVSISIVTDGTVLWNDPEGMALTFEGDNPSRQGLGGYFASIDGEDSAHQSLLLNYDTFPGLTASQAQSHNDVLANLMLSPRRFVAGTYQFTGAWGELAGTLEIGAAAIPEPMPVWALLCGLIALITHRASSMCERRPR